MKHTFPVRRTSSVIRLAVAAVSLLSAVPSPAATYTPIELTLEGESSYDGWYNLTNVYYKSVMFPGTGAWPVPNGSPFFPIISGAWTSYNTGSATVGAIGSNTVLNGDGSYTIDTGAGGDALLYKVANGLGGGPYPAGSSIYFGSFGAKPDTLGGTLGVADTNPLVGVQTLAFQVAIGAAWGYDFYKEDPGSTDIPLPSLYINGSLVDVPVTPTLLTQVYSTTTKMASGYEDVYVNLYGFQFDLSGFTEGIDKFELRFSAVEHAQLYALSLDQTDQAYGDVSIFPQALIWEGGEDASWSNAANWQNGEVGGATRNVNLTGAQSVTLDSDRTVGLLKITGEDGLGVSASNGAVLTTNAGIVAAPESGEASYTVSAPIFMEDFNLITVEENAALTLSGPITGEGFYKNGEGDFYLTGDNTYTGDKILITGGENYVSGVNTAQIPATLTVNDGRVILHGGDNRFSSNFSLNLYDSQVIPEGESTVQVTKTGVLVLGDANGKSDQTFQTITADQAILFNENAPTAEAVYANYSDAAIVGGHGSVSTLTVAKEGIFWGKLGGAGTNENNLALVKNGQGTLALNGASTYLGDTVINQGVLLINKTTALSANSNVVLNGGVLGLGGFTNSSGALIAGTSVGNLAINLGTGPGQLQFQGDGGFKAYYGNHAVTLNGGAQLTWGADHFIGDGKTLTLSSNAVANVLTFTNTIDLGSESRGILVESNGVAELSGVLSGDGGIQKLDKGELRLTAANTYAGDTVVNSGVLALTGASGSVAGDVVVNVGSEFHIRNTSSANNANRVGNSSGITLNGGKLLFDHNAGAANYSENIGGLVLGAGGSTVETKQAAASQTSSLTFGSLTRNDGAAVNFVGTGLGIDNRNKILFSTAPSLSNGILGGWATVGGTEFAAYDATNGIITYAGYTTDSSETTWAAAQNVKITGGTANKTTTLTADRGINSLNIAAPTAGTTTNNLNLGGKALRVGSGGIIMSSANSSRRTNITNGTLTAGATPDTQAELFVHTSGGSSTDGHTISASIVDNGTGAVTLIKAGSGALLLSGSNAHSGGTVLNQGTLVLNHSQALGTGVFTINGGSITSSSALGITHVLDVDQIWNDSFTFSQFATGSLKFTGDVTLGKDVQVSFGRQGGGQLTIAGSIGGDHGLIVSANQSDAVITFSGNNTYTGQTVIQAGASGVALRIGEGGTTGSLASDVTSTNGGTLIFHRSDSLTHSNLLDGNLNVTKQGEGTLTLTAENTYSGVTTINGGVLQLGDGGATGWLAGNVTGTSGTLAFNRSDDVVFRNLISGAIGLEKLGAGSLTLTAANTFTGNTTLSAGLLVLGHADALKYSTVVFNGGQIDYGDVEEVDLGDISGSGAQAITEGVTVNVGGAASGTSTYSGDLSGDGALNKTGNSTLVLSGSSSYTGGTTVSSGVIRASNNSALGSGSVSVASAGSLAVDSNVTLANNVVVAGGHVERAVETGSEYNLGTTGEVSSGSSPLSTSVNLLAGSASSETTLAYSFSSTPGFSASNDGARISDVFSLEGTGDDVFVLQLTVPGVTESSFLAWYDGESWVNAVLGNYEGNFALNNALTEQQGFLGSFNLFQNGDGGEFAGYGSDLADYVGAYGVDTASNSVWAVVNHNSDFGVVPEPGTWVLVIVSGCFLLLVRRRRITQ